MLVLTKSVSDVLPVISKKVNPLSILFNQMKLELATGTILGIDKTVVPGVIPGVANKGLILGRNTTSH
jgi:hypothetical protein